MSDSATTYIDTHAHIHSSEFEFIVSDEIIAAQKVGLTDIFCVGTSAVDSAIAVATAKQFPDIWAVVGQHPHEAASFGEKEKKTIEKLCSEPETKGVGEIGLDYWYLHSTKQDQKKAFRIQLGIAQSYNLPVSFHIRGSKDSPYDAFIDAAEILTEFTISKSVVHSFSAGPKALKIMSSFDCYYGLNGIATFTSVEDQIVALGQIPSNRVVLETDAPFLSPKPHRGSKNHPANIPLIASILADRLGITLPEFSKTTTENAKRLFSI